MSFRGVGLFEFLVEAELQQYYNNFKNDLKVQNISQLKWVTEEDLDSIGLSKPEIRRLKKYSNKFCAQNYLSKVRNKLMGRRETSLPAVPPLAASLYVSQPPHIVKSPPKHIIPSDAIVVNKELGTGEFGVVQQGVWTNDDGHRIQVAIKCLSKERMQSNPTEFLKEATIMHNIEHEHIVRLYGVVLENNTLMLVTELAPLRSLLECLKEPNLRPSFPVLTMCGFAVQICDGMHYLESKRLIHRDLAARNILVFSKNTVKISDFGLSRMLGVGKDYYQTNFNVNLKLPIAWCAPECINYLRFTSASDVWAFGVTLWEMFSYGFQPWAALTGQQILEAIDEPSFQRLEQPDACPKEYYRLMLQCWQHVPAQRPDFYQLTQLLPECKPEQVQAVEMASAPPSAAAPLKRERTLAYVIGEIVTVLDKRPLEDHPNMWKGVTNSGKTGLFNPSHFVAYIGSNLPRNSEARGSFGRGDAKTAYSSKRRLKPEMISAPQNDLKHTVHVGMDGTLFGDVSFLGDKYQQLPSRHGSLRQDRQDEAAAPLAMARADAEISDRAPLLSAGAAAAAAGGAPEPLQRTAGKLAAAGGAKHEYHEINSDSGAPAAAAGAQSLVDLERSQPSSQVCSEPDPFDLGPSLMDEVMSVLAPSCLSAVQPKPRDRIMSDESASGGEISNMCNEIREQGARYLREQSERKGKEPRMRDISESDRRTLEHAIAMANDLAARSMAALDAEPLDTPCTPSSPSKKKFTFKLKPSPPLSRRNFSSEAASIQDVQASLREKEREAYDILVQRTPQVQSALPIAAVQPTCHSIQDADESPLRLLRDRVGKQRKAIINAATIDRSQGVDRSKRKAVNGASGAGRETPPQLSPTKNGTGLQSWQRTMSIDRHLDAAPVSFDEPDDGGHNALPLPPRDRNKSSQDTSSKLRHQRKHPLVIPSSVPTTLPEMEPPSSFPAPVSLNAGCASRSDMSASSSSLFTASSLPRGSPPAKPPRLNLSSSLGEPPLPPAPLSASAVDGVAAAWCSTGDLLYTWRDHVSCEDLLEFAADRPNWRRTRGPAHGAHSDEVRIMLKVLGATADRQACVAALDRTGWDVHKAIKLRQAVSAVDSRVPAAEVAGALQQLDWDVNKAVEALTARHAAVGEPTVV